MKKNKGLRAGLNAMLTNPDLTSIPYMGMAQKVYKAVKVAQRPSGVRVSPCLRKWYDCLTDPFSTAAQGACIPYGDNISSARSYGFLRLQVTVGVDGVGFIAFSPATMNDNTACFYTTAAFTGGIAQILTANNTLKVGVVAQSMTNNRYSVQQITTPNYNNPQAAVRLVGGGIRMQYTGKEINRSGLIYAYTHPIHNSAIDSSTGNVVSINSIASLSAFSETYIKPCTRDVYEFPLTPVLTSELDYPPESNNTGQLYPWATNNAINSFNYTGPGGVNVGCPSTLIMFTGTAGETFQVEYAIHQEAIGQSTMGQRLPADADPVGVERMMAAISRATVSAASQDGSFKDHLKREYRAVTSGAQETSTL